MIESTIDFSGIDAIIKPELDQDLIKLQELVSSTEEEILDEINSIYKKLDMDEKKLKREFNTTYGHHLRVPRADSKSIKNYIELSTLKSGILFTSVGLKRLNNQLKENQESYNKKSSAVIKEVLGIVSTYVPVIEKISSVIGKLDVLMSFATCGNHAPSPYVRPTFNDDKRICLKECRHALIEGLSQFIPNNVEMIGGSSNFQVYIKVI